jgi:phosphatidate cytidylyltransferase
MKRVVTAVLLVPIVLIVVLRAPDLLFALLLAVVALLAQREFYNLARPSAPDTHGGGAPPSRIAEPYRVLGGIAGFLMIVAFTVAPDFVALPGGAGALLATAWAPLLLLVVVLLLRALSGPLPQSLTAFSVTLAGVFYPVLLLALLGDIRRAEYGRWWIIFLLVTVWVGDTAAYYVGRSLGRHRMAPNVSPKKTWEGAAASLLASGLLGGCLIHWAAACTSAAAAIHLASSPIEATGAFGSGLLLAIVINVFAQLGDLVESALKRGAGVKDSGMLLPGHGGILDRVDALLLAAPVLWYLLIYRAG